MITQRKWHVLAAGFVLILAAGVTQLAAQDADYPAMPGFDLEGSDPEAIAIAGRVMERMGGWQAWNETRYVTWKFFGRRLHVWDKHTGNCRIETNDMVALMNLNSREGRVWRNGVEVTDPDTLAPLLKRAEAAWINDSYWVFMPYKLKDSGVTLKYKGEGTLQDGRAADILQLTFNNVGNTPQNKYDVYVSKDESLVEQWAFYPNASDPEPRFVNTWGNWQRYGNIMISDERGNGRKHTDIAVFDSLPASVFESPEPVNWQALKQE